MLVPLRSGTWMSAAALVRVKRGSTWMNLAPRSLAFITHWQPTGWFAAMLEVAMMTSEFWMSIRFVVIAPPPECGPQSWDRGGVSDSGLVFVVDDPEGAVQLGQQIAFLVVGAGRPQGGDRLQPVARDLLVLLRLLLLDEVLLTRLVIALGDLVVHPLERLLLPRLRSGRAIERLGRPQRVVGELGGGRALR